MHDSADASQSTTQVTGAADFSCVLSEVGDMTAVSVTGELDMATCPELDWALRNVSAETSSVVLDLRGLNFMDSTGLHVIITANERLRREGRQLLVVRGPAAIQRVFAVSGVDRALQLTDQPPEMASSEETEDEAA
jgi:anti-sigma B factor antagonist